MCPVFFLLAVGNALCPSRGASRVSWAPWKETAREAQCSWEGFGDLRTRGRPGSVGWHWKLLPGEGAGSSPAGLPAAWRLQALLPSPQVGICPQHTVGWGGEMHTKCVWPLSSHKIFSVAKTRNKICLC